jgi:drug/metabolite transporter (DMT)-like permease
MRARRVAAAAGGIVVVSLLAAPPALAHGLPSPPGVPVPGYVFAYAAAAVLAGSFYALSRLWREPKLEGACCAGAGCSAASPCSTSCPARSRWSA